MEKSSTEVVVFAGGCFWCTEAVFKMLKGIKSVDPGYAGGTIQNPTYEQVSTGKTGHAEVVRIEYDPSEIKFNDLLTVFFATHDPTTLNRQGADVGSQYRSAIFYTTEEQHKEAMGFIHEINRSSPNGAPAVTEVKPLGVRPDGGFYRAEDYHRDYFKKNPQNPYCRVVINPKLEKVQNKFATLLAKL